jgi:hypothetical protein
MQWHTGNGQSTNRTNEEHHATPPSSVAQKNEIANGTTIEQQIIIIYGQYLHLNDH